MANCCNYEPCEGLVTIGYMKSLSSQSPAGCHVTIKNGTTASTCCSGTTIGDNYVPTYQQLTANTFTSARRVTYSDPSDDKNGFIYLSPSAATSDCCNININQKALMTSEISFGYTLADDNILEITTQPTSCDPSYTVTETKKYSRHTLTCTGETGSGDVITITDSHSGTLETVITKNSDTSWTISFVPQTVNGITSAPCNDESSSINVSLSQYNITYTITWPTNVNCAGGTYNVITNISGVLCNDDLSFNVAADDSDITATTASTGCTVTIPRNEYDSSGFYLTITPIIKGETQENITNFISRGICDSGWSPNVQTENCSVFEATINWQKTNPPIYIIVHD